jgi:D-alanyl-D-alanine carboxypeptidase (penicillin-binding protein 5/6)
MRHPRKRQTKKLIYLEMIVLSILLVIAVIVASPSEDTGTKKDKHANDSKDVFAEASLSSTTAPTPAPAPAPTWKTYPADRQITARQYFVFDCQKQMFLSNSGQENDRIYPASVTKLFTAFTIMECTLLGSDEYCIVGDELDLVAYGSSVANLKKGDKLTAMQLMEGMLMCSGNDAAYVLACQAGRNLTGNKTLNPTDAVKVFMNKMNEVLKQHGMTGTNLTNPDGIHDPNHYTTPHDLVILANRCLQFDSIKAPSITPEAKHPLRTDAPNWKNTNLLVNPQSEYYCPHAIGLKTGQTPAAGCCLLSAFYKDGQYLLIGVFGSPTPEDRFDDTLQLFNQAVLK